MRIKYLIGLLAVLLSVSMASGCAGSDGTEGENNSAAEAGGNSLSDQEAASAQVVFEGKDIDGNTVSSDIFAESKITMVNVWATYCNPCLREMPAIGELAGEYDASQFQVIGIISDVQEGAAPETLDMAADLIEMTSADYAHLLLNESLYYALLTDVSAVPTTFFIDGDGKILDVVIGARDKDGWKEMIDEYLENSKKHAWIWCVLAGVCCFGLGLAEGQFAVIWKKAVMICLECIGIG